MATRTPVRTQISTNCVQYQWTGLLNGDDGSPVEVDDLADQCVEFSGTAGVGLAASWQGGNVAANYYILNSVQGAAITFAAPGIKQVAEAPRFMRPIITAGDGTTSMVATLFCRRNR